MRLRRDARVTRWPLDLEGKAYEQELAHSSRRQFLEPDPLDEVNATLDNQLYVNGLRPPGDYRRHHLDCGVVAPDGKGLVLGQPKSRLQAQPRLRAELVGRPVP